MREHHGLKVFFAIAINLSTAATIWIVNPLDLTV